MNVIIANLLILLLFTTGCAQKQTKIPENWKEIDSVSLLDNNTFKYSLDAFKKSCVALAKNEPFSSICKNAQKATDAKSFFQDNFVLKPLIPDVKSEYETLMTGYFEPMLHGSLTQTDRFKYPLYATPKNIADRTKSRKEIEKGKLLDSPICFVDDVLDLYFLQVQGSGRVKLTNGETIFVGYAAQNGHPYTSIGKILTSSNEIDEDKISLQTIREWVAKYPQKRDWLLHQNSSYVFFAKESRGASGSLGVELTPEFSIAVDPRFIPMGYPVLLATVHPLTKKPFSRLAMAQDTGGAIKGPVRADLFWGHGEYAKECAGKMKNDVRLWLLLPKK